MDYMVHGVAESVTTERLSLHRWLSGEEPACNAGDTGEVGLIPVLGRSPGEGKGYLLQYSGLENSKGLSLWASLIAQLVKNALAM